ncbi:MAG: 23S rRNA (uracil(1939)-C(5))-methyltransferase RlmD [Erysipelotrichia bacterium]|nr:23S rRNA (uracil(1939)-C(5))-methyltransferase RlmD [Erysipelotrichia bacterium]
MLKKKERIKGKITHISNNGSGLFFYGKDKIIVRNVLLGEVVEVEVIKKVKEGYACQLMKLVTASKQRVKVKCPYYQQCGSCHLLHVDYKHQLQMKKQMIVDMVNKEKLKQMKVQDCIGMSNPYAYRNKIIISFGKKKKEVVAGFYGEYSHHIIPIKNCLLHEDYVNHLIEDIKQLVKRCRIEVFDEDRGTGFLRHILIRRGVETNQTLLVLVGAEKIFKAKNNFIKELKKLHPEINSVIFNYNPRKTSVVLGNHEQVLYGKGYIEDILCGKRFKISSQSFYQINHEQCEKLYNKALSLLTLNGKEKIVDAYCGIGTIGIIASDQVKQVYGVEINKDAIKDATMNAKMNQISNVTFKCDDAGKFMVNLASEKRKIDVVIMDPAREGSDENFLSSLVKLAPKQVVYISCNPQTQIRDIKYLYKYGYTCKEMFLYDLFPNTFHVESVCLLVRK